MKKLAEKTQQTNKIVDALSHLLADTYILYVKTQNFHWNVTGPHFYAYHQLFEEQYKALVEAIDVIAERIRSLGAHAPASLAAFLKLTSLKESDEKLNAQSMLQTLLNNHESIANTISKLFDVIDECGDEVTLDLLVERKTEHDKFAWMLRSSLKE